MCEYETKVGEVRGRRFPEPPTARCRGMESLRKEGTDHLSVYVEHLHKKGIKCLAEIRMSDTHHRRISIDEIGCPMFTIEHPEWIIKRNDGIQEVAMDYSYTEVRTHRLAIMTELANEYDIDGLELNFNRWAKHFERDKGREKAHIMTDFISRIYEMLQNSAKRKNREKLLLGVRMPSTIEECRLAGCDPATWVKNGWIDYLIVAEHNCTWPGTHIEESKIFCKNRCEVYVQMGDMMGGCWQGKPRITGREIAQFKESYNGMLLTNEEARAAAYNFYTWGADGIAFWNISCNTGTQGKWSGPASRKRIFGWMNRVIDLKKAKNGKRVYHYLPLYKGISQREPNYTYKEELRSPIGAFKGQVLTFSTEDAGKRKTFRFRMADGRTGDNGNLNYLPHHCFHRIPVQPESSYISP